MPELSDEQLIGGHWPIGQLDPLADDEKVQLIRYRHRTQGFGERGEEFITTATQPGEQVDDHDAHAVLDSWHAPWKEPRDWHHMLNGVERPTRKTQTTTTP